MEMRSIAAVVALLAVSAPLTAEADPPEILWPETNPRFHWTEYGLTCGAALTLASIGAFSRITNRSHYASDTVLGAGIGLTIGYLMPFLLHYRDGVITPMAGELIGVGYSGSF